MSKVTFPDKLFVYQYSFDGSDPVLVTIDDIQNMPAERNGITVAIYALVEQKTFKTKKELV